LDSNRYKILVLYHYYRPDDVVSAIQMAELCEGLTSRGWEVEVWSANRSCHQGESSYAIPSEFLQGVSVRRVWRPSWRQHSFPGRIANSVWMQTAWFWRLLTSSGYRPDVILTGTDPLFTVWLTPFLKWLRPQAKQVHWCFDLYPEAAAADGIIKERNALFRLVKGFMNRGYGKCDLVVNIGSCMRERLEGYNVKKSATLTPWALEESQTPLFMNQAERMSLFGDSELGLLYSGNFGRAHDFKLTFKLARWMGDKAGFVYGVRGSRLNELKKAVTLEDANIRFVDFAPTERLSARLSAPDVHMVSLRPEWTGMVVPSKFFGALAAGRPILFEGSLDSSLARWIGEYKVGWVLNPDNLEKTASELLWFSGSQNQKNEMFRHCHEIYQTHFSKTNVIDQWNSELRTLLG